MSSGGDELNECKLSEDASIVFYTPEANTWEQLQATSAAIAVWAQIIELSSYSRVQTLQKKKKLYGDQTKARKYIVLHGKCNTITYIVVGTASWF